MLNFFKNKINKQIVNFAFTSSKTINTFMAINKKSFLTTKNFTVSNKFPNKTFESTRGLLLKENFLKINSKHFNSNEEPNDNKDKKAASGATERRRLGKQKESTEEVLKKKIESLKILEKEKQQKEIEKAKEEALKQEALKEEEKLNTTESTQTASEAAAPEIKTEVRNEKTYEESNIGKGVGASAQVDRIDESDMDQELKEEKERIQAKILGDLRRLDAAKNFNSKEINELYDILAKINNAPKLEEKVYERRNFQKPVESFTDNWRYHLKKILVRVSKRIFRILLLVFLYHLYIYYFDKKELFHDPNIIDKMLKYKEIVYLIYKTLTMPYHSRLLPDMIILPGQPIPKTLVINFEDTIVHTECHLGQGKINFKRPYLSRFLEELSNVYEIVIFSSKDDTHSIQELCKDVDKFDTYIRHYLGKEATLRYEGKHIKDLNFLNRDLKNIIVIDRDPESVKKHPNNLIILPDFLGDPNDQELKHIIPFLKEMAKPSVTDVRKELEKYGNYKPHIKFYSSNPKYQKLVPKDKSLYDDEDIAEIRELK